MKPITRVMNPLVLRVAGRRRIGMLALVFHRGRRSGRTYRTPVGARTVGGRMWIPLSFGSGSDWCRNVLAAGGCDVQWKGTRYAARRPRIARRDEADEAFAAYPLMQRLTLRLIRLDAFLALDVTSRAADSSMRRDETTGGRDGAATA
jgi:deazaflavin-dependent oxidoreductase (nitroreductase family)